MRGFGTLNARTSVAECARKGSSPKLTNKQPSDLVFVNFIHLCPIAGRFRIETDTFGDIRVSF